MCTLAEMKLSEKKRGQPGIKPVYRVEELARMVGLSRFAVLRLLKRYEVPTIRSGRTVLVPLVAFRVAFPDLWESVLWARSMG